MLEEANARILQAIRGVAMVGMVGQVFMGMEGMLIKTHARIDLT
ncbi:MAG: hypothetical protein ACSNEK_09110 [Parachlamydiaceae bacterium]